jgi:AraC family transcriptional regulator
MLNVKVSRFPAIHTVMLKRFGPYEGIGEAFDALFAWVEANNVPVQRTIGVYWDNPDYVDAPTLRSAACVEVPQGVEITNPGQLRLLIEDIPAGQYATTRYVGPYENLTAVWTEFTNHVEGHLGLTINPTLGAFEVYVNDAEKTPPDQLVTELFMPVS